MDYQYVLSICLRPSFGSLEYWGLENDSSFDAVDDSAQTISNEMIGFRSMRMEEA